MKLQQTETQKESRNLATQDQRFSQAVFFCLQLCYWIYYQRMLKTDVFIKTNLVIVDLLIYQLYLYKYFRYSYKN